MAQNTNEMEQEENKTSVEELPMKQGQQENIQDAVEDDNKITQSADNVNDIKEDDIKTITNPNIDEQTRSRYFTITAERRTRFKTILTKMDEFQFKLSKSTNVQFTINDNKFTLETRITYSKPFKNEPTVWYLETIMPGTPELFLQYWGESENRLKYDKQISSHQVIHIHKNDKSKLFFINTQTLPAVGGLISPRQFTDLMQCWSINEGNVIGFEKASKSINCKEFPPKNGFVDASNILTGQRITLIDDKELKEMCGIPNVELKGDNANGEILKWCRVKSVLQTDIKGWIPTSVVEFGISDGMIASYARCRLYMLKEVFGLDVNVSQI